MSMSPESENFEQLRRLLVLKRYEQPPPGYFHHFSREVIVRIKAGDKGESATAAWWSWEGSWLQRAWAAVETRPALAGAFGLAVCGFFGVGALLTDNPDANVDVQVANAMPVGAVTHDTAQASAAATPAWALPAPVLQVSQPSLFDEIQRFQRSPQAFMNVNYAPGH
jgi:hypothetical protein